MSTNRPAVHDRYQAVRSAAAGVAVAFRSRAPRQIEPSSDPMVDRIVRDLATPHRPTGGCLCAGCLSTRNYTTAAVLAAAAASKGDQAGAFHDAARWHERLGDAYYAAHRVAVAVGWQRPATEERRALRDRWASRSVAGTPTAPSRSERRVPGRRP
jgi:hypothetical protein